MLQAQVYYYPSGLGHIGINIIFDKDDLLSFARRKEIKIKLLHKDSWWLSNYDKEMYHIPALISEGNGEYTVWGYKNHRWRKTPLNNLSLEERVWLEKLNFPINKKYNVSEIALPISMYSLIEQGHPDLIRREYFFDWGGTYDFDSIERCKGSPLRIDLPPVKTSSEDFWKAAMKMGRHKFYQDYTSDSIPDYNLFTNNCAHSVLDLLYCAGYTSKKPCSSFDIFPFVAALKASQLANQLRPVFRKQLVNHKEQHNETTLINSIIKMSCSRLKEAIHFNFGNLFGGCISELTRLKAIKFDGSQKSIERLLQASEMASPDTLKELQSCIALIEPQQCFLSCIARLETIANQLKKNNKAKLQKITSCLQQELELFQEKKTSYQEFSTNCCELIGRATPILEEESSVFLQVLKNIAIAVCGLIVFYLAAAYINKANSGNFLFFNDPALSLVTRTMQSSIDNLSQNKSAHELSMVVNRG